MKSLSKIIFIAAAIIMFAVCNSNEVVEPNAPVMQKAAAEPAEDIGDGGGEIPIEERFEIAKQAAAFHSGGLSYAFDNLLAIQDADPEYFQNTSIEEQSALFLEMSVNYIANSELVAISEEMDKQFPLSYEPNPELVSYFYETMSNVMSNFEYDFNIDNLENVLFKDIMYSDEFASFKVSEQNQILLSFAIIIDSFNYWNNDLYKWNNEFGKALGSEVYLPEEPIFPVEPDGLKIKLPGWAKKALHVLNVDGTEGTIGAIAGGLGGAAVGALAGGVGAGPGAVGGAVSVGVTTAVYGSIKAAIPMLRINTNSEPSIVYFDSYGNMYPDYILRYSDDSYILNFQQYD